MNAEIDELDQLAVELLTYARFDRDKPEINDPAASWRDINVTPAKADVQGFQPLDSGVRQNDGIRSKLRGIEPIEIKISTPGR